MSVPVMFSTADAPVGGMLVFGSQPLGSSFAPSQTVIPTSPQSPLSGFIVFGAQPFGGQPFTGTATSTTTRPGILTMAAWAAGPADVGDTITLAVMVLDADGQPAAADQVLASVTVGGVATVLAVANPSVGRYETTLTIQQDARHTVAFLGAGGPLGAGQVYADALPVADAGGLFIAVPQALAHLRAADIFVTHSDREQLRWLALVACRAIEEDIGRVIARRVVVEDHDPGESHLILDHSPVLALTSIAIDGRAVATDDYRLGRHGLIQGRTPFGRPGWGVVTVSYVAGMDPVPVVLQKVALNAVARMWQTSQNSPHPALGDGSGGGGDFAATAILAQLGRLTPVEYGAYLSYRAAVVG